MLGCWIQVSVSDSDQKKALHTHLFLLLLGQPFKFGLNFSLLLGAVIGWLDPWAIATAWVLTATSAAVFAGVGLRTGRLARDSAVPFGPFMVLGSVAAMALTLASNS